MKKYRKIGAQRYKYGHASSSTSSTSNTISSPSGSNSTNDQSTGDNEMTNFERGRKENDFKMRGEFQPLRTSSPVIFSSDESVHCHTSSDDSQLDSDVDSSFLFKGSDVPTLHCCVTVW